MQLTSHLLVSAGGNQRQHQPSLLLVHVRRTGRGRDGHDLDAEPATRTAQGAEPPPDRLQGNVARRARPHAQPDAGNRRISRRGPPDNAAAMEHGREEQA